MYKSLYLLLLIVMASSCSILPEGPTVNTLPGSNKSYQTYQLDNQRCQQLAKNAAGPKTANEEKQEVASQQVLVGGLLGAFFGALIGAHPSDIAATATHGMLLGSLTGEEVGNVAGHRIQKQYDKAYIRCMYSAGHRIPAKNVIYIEKAPQKKPVSPRMQTPSSVPPDFKPK